jgi:uncharacterized protein (TIRG00374 family)
MAAGEEHLGPQTVGPSMDGQEGAQPRLNVEPVGAAKTSIRTILWNLTGALVFGALGFFALSLISHQLNVVKVVRSMRPVYILTALGLIIMEIVVQALRLEAILRALGLRISIRSALRTILVGEFFARVTPFAAGGGEPAQAYMLFKDNTIGVADSTMVFAIKAIMAGASQMVVFAFVPVWLIFSGRSLDVGNRFQIVLYIGIAMYVAFFVILLVSLSRMQQLSSYIDRVMSRETGRLSRLGRLWQVVARRTNAFVKEMLKAKETALHANRGHMTRGLVYSFISWGLVVVTPITLLYGLGVTSSVTQIIVATMIYYIAISYFPTPGASVGAELGAVALFAAFVPAGILGAFILVWRFFDHYIKMGAGGLMTFAEFVFKPARKRRRAVRQSRAGETKEKDGEP